MNEPPFHILSPHFMKHKGTHSAPPVGRQQPAATSRWAQQHRRLHAESGQCHWPCHGTSGPHSRHHPATPVVWLPVAGWTTGQPPSSWATNFWSLQVAIYTMKIGFRDNACPPLWMHGRGPEDSRGISHIPWEANTLDALELSPRSITTKEGLLPIAVPYESCQKKNAYYIHGCAHPHWWTRWTGKFYNSSYGRDIPWYFHLWCNFCYTVIFHGS